MKKEVQYTKITWFYSPSLICSILLSKCLLLYSVYNSYAVPSLGIKCDAYPGRLNQVSALINRPGVFLGQCSELCGLLHHSMPVSIECHTLENYLTLLREL